MLDTLFGCGLKPPFSRFMMVSTMTPGSGFGSGWTIRGGTERAYGVPALPRSGFWILLKLTIVREELNSQNCGFVPAVSLTIFEFTAKERLRRVSQTVPQLT